MKIFTKIWKSIPLTIPIFLKSCLYIIFLILKLVIFIKILVCKKWPKDQIERDREERKRGKKREWVRVKMRNPKIGGHTHWRGLKGSPFNTLGRDA